MKKLKTVDPNTEVHTEAPIASDYYETEYGEYDFSEKDIDTLCGDAGQIVDLKIKDGEIKQIKRGEWIWD